MTLTDVETRKHVDNYALGVGRRHRGIRLPRGSFEAATFDATIRTLSSLSMATMVQRGAAGCREKEKVNRYASGMERAQASMIKTFRDTR